MSFDLFEPVRGLNEHCKYWKRNELTPDEETNEYVYKRVPSGYFYAQEVTAQTSDKNIINGLAMFDRTKVTLRSTQNLGMLESGDWVEYQGMLWRVEDAQKRVQRRQNTEFAAVSSVSRYWYLNLVSGTVIR